MDFICIETFTCPVCLELPHTPYECNKCGQLFCSPCKKQINKESNKCPMCRAQNSFQRNVFCEKLVANLKISCKFNCGEKISFREYEEHTYVCEAREYSCSIEYCKFKGLRSELFNHLYEFHIEKLTFLAENFMKMQKDFNPITTLK